MGYRVLRHPLPLRLGFSSRTWNVDIPLPYTLLLCTRPDDADCCTSFTAVEWHFPDRLLAERAGIHEWSGLG
jgi:hypothetical protein